MVLALRLYRRVVSPLLPPACRFSPTCSEYAIEALETHGLVRGSYMTLARLLRCHPFHPGGHDPVPGPRRNKERKNGSTDHPRHRSGHCDASDLPARVRAERTAGRAGSSNSSRGAPSYIS